MNKSRSTAGLVDDEAIPMPERSIRMSEEHDPAPAPETVPEPSKPPEPHPSDALIERWWEEHFPNTHLSRDTQSWAIARAAKEKLKLLLRSK
jgi:hypothetical protein